MQFSIADSQCWGYSGREWGRRAWQVLQRGRFAYIMKYMLFAWDDWNIDHISEHKVVPCEAEFVIDCAEVPWPEQKGDDKFAVWGPTDSGRLLQVIFTLKDPDEIEFESLTIDQWSDLSESDQIVYVIHAMELTAGMKRRYRKRRRNP